MDINSIIDSIAESTAEAIRDYDIITCIESIKNDTSRMISEILTANV